MPTIRAKKAILSKVYEQFQQYGLDTTVTYEEYVKVVGQGAVPRRVLSGWHNRWLRLLGALRKQYPDVDTVAKNTLKVEEPVVEVKKSSLDKLKALSASKEEMEDDE